MSSRAAPASVLAAVLRPALALPRAPRPTASKVVSMAGFSMPVNSEVPEMAPPIKLPRVVKGELIMPALGVSLLGPSRYF